MSGDAEAAIALVMNAWRNGRPIVPFVGAGISIAAGFPDTPRLTRYLAQTKFALDKALYKSRYPFIPEGLERAEDFYRRRPAEFIADFNWPEIGQLNADIWRWIDRTAKGTRKRDNQDKHLIHSTDKAVQSVLLERLEEVEPHAAAATFAGDKSLRGDWPALLDYLAEGQLDLIDALFVGLDKNRIPSRAHVFLTFLIQLMGIRLVLTTNFDTLIEQAMHREGC